MHEHAHEETAAAEPAARIAAPAGPGATPLATVQMLQRAAGNQATLRWLAREFENTEGPSTTLQVDAIPLADVDSTKKSLARKYSIKITGSWSADDLKDLEDGLSLLTATEAGRVKGFDMVRVASLNGPSGLTTKDGKHDKIEFADEAFDRGATGGVAKRTPLTINGGTQGRHVVCHEVGHVVLYTNSDTTAEDTWNKNARAWITQELSPMPNGQVSAPTEELYCEAFACFKTGPEALKKKAPKAHAFFAGGSYLS